MSILSVDIGSTWTKGALFEIDGRGELQLVGRDARPTTVDNLSKAFFQVRDALDPHGRAGRLFYSSSAKGGLAVAALGIVPEVTSEMARIAAWSAGARLSEVYSYRLTRSDIAALEANPPDILLFAGGTDGGNTDYVLANAEKLARSTLDCAIVYAGNRAVRDDVAEILADRDVSCVDNLLPAMGEPNPEPARAAIREVFLDRIVHGKGLDTIVRETGAEPVPTPYAVYDYCALIRTHVPGWEEFMLVDLGGATTDVYSWHEPRHTHGTVQRGLPEPGLKRTVEGDLGMRVSARPAVACVRALTNATGDPAPDRLDALTHHAESVAAAPDILPSDDNGRALDALLAGACLATACGRHAGRMHEVSTVEGLVNVQVGRDLGGVRRVIGSGGYLASAGGFDPNPWLARLTLDERGKRILTPRNVAFHRDEHYLFPLLANAARGYPAAAARAGIRHLHTEIDTAA